MKSIIAMIARHPGTVCILAMLVAAAAIIPASRLHLSTDLTSLLPSDSEAAEAFRVYLDVFGAAERVFITIEGTQESHPVSGGLLAEAAFQIAENLERRSEVASARAGLDERDEAMFMTHIIERSPLLIDDPGWEVKVRQRLQPDMIRERVRFLRSAAIGPSGSSRSAFFEHDPLGFSEDLDTSALSDFGLTIDPSTMAFLSPDLSKALIIVDPSSSELDPEAGRNLAAAINQAVEAAASELSLSLSSEAVGGPLFAAHDEAVIRGDLQTTLSATALLCSLLLVVAFAGIGIPLAGLISLGTALLWLAAGLSLTRGSVSTAVIGFGAVLIGLGIDAAIHGGASLRRRLLAGLSQSTAAIETIREIGPAVLTASMTTGAAFAVLGFSVLPPLRELGLIIAAGMVAVVTATTLVGLPLALLMHRFHGRAGTLWIAIGRVIDNVVSVAERHPKTIVVSALLVTLASVFQLNQIEILPDLNRLRPAEHPVVEAGRRLASTFGIGEDTATLIVTGSNLDEALERAHITRKMLVDSDPDISVISPDQRMKGPRFVGERLTKLKELPFERAAEVLRTEMVSAGLRPDAFAAGFSIIEAYGMGRDPGADRIDFDDQIRIATDNRTMVGLAIRLPADLWQDGPPESLRQAVEAVAPGALFASIRWIGSDLRRLASRDLRRLSVLSLSLILVVVGLSFKGRPGLTLLALSPVLLGTTWAFGVWGWMGRPLDLFGLAILPVMLGLGIDDGLYSVHGAGHQGALGIGRSVRNSGRAMVLTTLTTAIAFASLGMSHLPALKAAAILVPLAVLACLAATLMVLPAIAALTGGRK